jgi:hypothetical protein
LLLPPCANLLQLEKMLLRFETTRKPGEGTGFTNDAVTGRDDGDWIVAVGRSDRPRRLGITELARNLPVRTCFSKWNTQQLLLDLILERLDAFSGRGGSFLIATAKNVGC